MNDGATDGCTADEEFDDEEDIVDIGRYEDDGLIYYDGDGADDSDGRTQQTTHLTIDAVDETFATASGRIMKTKRLPIRTESGVECHICSKKMSSYKIFRVSLTVCRLVILFSFSCIHHVNFVRLETPAYRSCNEKRFCL